MDPWSGPQSLWTRRVVVVSKKDQKKREAKDIASLRLEGTLSLTVLHFHIRCQSVYGSNENRLVTPDPARNMCGPPTAIVYPQYPSWRRRCLSSAASLRHTASRHSSNASAPRTGLHLRKRITDAAELLKVGYAPWDALLMEVLKVLQKNPGRKRSLRPSGAGSRTKFCLSPAGCFLVLRILPTQLDPETRTRARGHHQPFSCDDYGQWGL